MRGVVKRISKIKKLGELRMDNFAIQLKDANNAYRTRDYIVTQEIKYVKDAFLGSYIESHDVFYKRTKDRDAIYEKVFALRFMIDGDRIHSRVYTRNYL